MNKEEFSTRITLLTDELYEANELFIGYLRLYNKQASNIVELNIVPGFFQLAIKAFFELFVLKMARLFEDSDQSLSLYRISGWIEQSKELREALILSRQSITTIKAYLEKSNDYICSLKILRDKLLAHTDKQQLTHDFWQDAGLSIQKYRCLIDTAHEIICICRLILNQPVPSLNMGVETDIDHLMSILSESHATQ